MTADVVERDVQRTATKWAFIQGIETVDKTDFAVKMRLHVETDCFVQVTPIPKNRSPVMPWYSTVPVFLDATVKEDSGIGIPLKRLVNTTSHQKANALFRWMNSSQKYNGFSRTRPSCDLP